MHLRDALHKRQAEAERGALPVDRKIVLERGGALPAGQQGVEQLCIQPGAAVRDRDGIKRAVIGQDDTDIAVRRRDAQRVRKQVVQSGAHQPGLDQRKTAVRRLYVDLPDARRARAFGSALRRIAAERRKVVIVQPELLGQRRIVQEIRMGQQAVQPQAFAPQMRGELRVLHLLGVREQRTQVLHALCVDDAQAAVVRGAVLAEECQQRAVPVRQDLQPVDGAVQLFIYGLRCARGQTGLQRFGRGVAQHLVGPLHRMQAGQLPRGLVAVFHVQRRPHGDERSVAQRGAREQRAQRRIFQIGEEIFCHLYPPNHPAFSLCGYKAGPRLKYYILWDVFIIPPDGTVLQRKLYKKAAANDKKFTNITPCGRQPS